MAIAYLNHTPIGKATQKRAYTARAHIWYITRPNHTHYTYSERMPLHRHAVMRFVTEREDTIRKNGRVMDKLIIALPREQSMEQNVDTLRDFGFRLSEGRAPFFFSIQDYGTENPHAHFVYIDADVETGERVAFTTKRGSTERIKSIWADTCNGHLLENGIEAQIEFGAKEQVLEAANDDVAPERPDLPLEAPVEESVEIEPNEGPAMLNYGTETLQGAIQADEELEMLRSERARLDGFEQEVSDADSDLRTAQTLVEELQASYYSARNEADAARDIYQLYLKGDGALKGFRLGIGSWDIYKSRDRIKAEEAKALRERADLLVKDAEAAKAAAEHARSVAETVKREAAEKRQEMKHYLSTRGTPEQLDSIERDFAHTRDFYMEGVTFERIQEAHEKGELTEAQVERAAKIMGKEQELEVYRAKADIPESEAPEDKKAKAKALVAEWTADASLEDGIDIDD